MAGDMVANSQPTTPFVGTPTAGTAIQNNDRQHNESHAVQSHFSTSTTPKTAIEIFTRPVIEPLHYPQQQYSGGVSERTDDETTFFNPFPIHIAEGQQQWRQQQPQIGQVPISQLVDVWLATNNDHSPLPSFSNNSFGGLQGNHCYPEQQQPLHNEAGGNCSKTNLHISQIE